MIKINAFYENTKILIITFLISLTYLIIYITYMDKYTPYEIDELNIKLNGEKIKTCGELSKYIIKEKYNIIYLKNENKTIKIIDFNKKPIPKESVICIKGTYKIYKGEGEIILKEYLE